MHAAEHLTHPRPVEAAGVLHPQQLQQVLVGEGDLSLLVDHQDGIRYRVQQRPQQGRPQDTTRLRLHLGGALTLGWREQGRHPLSHGHPLSCVHRGRPWPASRGYL